MKKRMQQQGYILLAVLIILQLCALLTMHCLSTIQTQLQMVRREWQMLQNKIVTDEFIKKLEKNISQDKLTCQHPLTDVNQLTRQPLKWWRAIACYHQNKQVEYYYFWEYLQTNLCAKIVTDAHLIADYYRLNLLVLFREATALLIQNTFVLPRKSAASCSDSSHVVHAGRQTSRELIVTSS